MSCQAEPLGLLGKLGPDPIIAPRAQQQPILRQRLSRKRKCLKEIFMPLVMNQVSDDHKNQRR